MEIYIASFAGLLSAVLLAAVYAADRYEPEPIGLIQDFFLSGLLVQLVAILALSATVGSVLWAGPWILATVAGAMLYLPFRLARLQEMDERFDGIVYSAAFVGGAVCVVHLNNLPQIVAASPFRDALAAGAKPDLRDLTILATSPGFAQELGQGFVVLVATAFAGAVIGVLHLRSVQPLRVAAASTLCVILVVGSDFAFGGSWILRGSLFVSLMVVAYLIKRRSVHRDRPEPLERDVLVLGFKTVLIIFGAVLLATVMLGTVVQHPDPPDHGQLDGDPPVSGGTGMVEP